MLLLLLLLLLSSDASDTEDVEEEAEEVEAPMEAFDDDDAMGSCSSFCGRTWDVCFWGSWVL